MESNHVPASSARHRWPRAAAFWATPGVACVSAVVLLAGGVFLCVTATTGALVPILFGVGAMLAGTGSLAVHVLAADAAGAPAAAAPVPAAEQDAEWWPDFEREFWAHVEIQVDESAGT